jgi:putative IMPACT (imprinted ancient) family translation regulator
VTEVIELQLRIDYAQLSKVENYLSVHPDIHVEALEYGEKIDFKLFILEEQANVVQSSLTDLLNGRLHLKEGVASTREIPIDFLKSVESD